MIDPGFDDFVSRDSVAMLFSPDGDPDKAADIAGHLLWGDGVRLLGEQAGDMVKVRARGRRRSGWVPRAALGGQSLLEFYFIDVGQGDGILIKTPDFRHIMIDGGYPRRAQNGGKSGADFVDWKFFEDYGLDAIALDAMVASHNDYDHFGGLADLLDTEQISELDARTLTIERFYHAGLSWWKRGSSRTLGMTATAHGRRWFTQLLGDRSSVESAVATHLSGPKLSGAWGQFIAKALDAKTADGSPTPIDRIGSDTAMLPGFDTGDVRIHIFGPVVETVDHKPALPKFPSSDSQSTNGNSILMRIDFGAARVLMTGDLNRASQAAILGHIGDPAALASDVAKACHHGSEDISIAFLQAIEAGATIISSGDGEGHDHPRPVVVAASGLTGFRTIEDDALKTPLVYSTELARSTSIGRPAALEVMSGGGEAQSFERDDFERMTLDFTETAPGAIAATRKTERFSRTRVLGKLIYGLVNVRTDGADILCATMNESDGSWAKKKFKARFT